MIFGSKVFEERQISAHKHKQLRLFLGTNFLSSFALPSLSPRCRQQFRLGKKQTNKQYHLRHFHATQQNSLLQDVFSGVLIFFFEVLALMVPQHQ